MFAKLRLAALPAVVAASLATAPAGASDILEACSADIKTYCSAVEPGYGRLISCLYAHELVISDACDAATSDMSDILDTMFASLRTVVEQCSGDIQKLCEGVAPGEGRIFTCLATNEKDLSDGCASVMSVVKMPGHE